MNIASTEFASGWGVIVSSAAGFGLGLSGLPFYTMAVFVEPLTQAFHWSLAEIQGGLTLMLLSNVVTLPLAAWLAERFGGRIVGLASVGLFSLSFMALAGLNGGLLDYDLHWILMSAAGAGTLAVVWTQVITSWFSKARGAALGAAMTGTGITALFAPLLAHGLIEAFGWRTAYVILGALPMLIALPLVWRFFRANAQEDGPARPQARRPTAGAVTADWRFWLIGTAFLLVGAAVAGIIPNLVKMLRGHGLTALQASGAASLVGLFVIFGRAACGVLLDRFWASAVAATFFIFAGFACLVLRAPHLETPVLWATAAAIGLAAGAEFDVLPYLASRYFALEHVSQALGLLSMFFYVGAAAGPWGVGWLADLSRGYEAPLIAAAGLFMVGGLSLLSLGRYPRQAE
jgi:MFS family permease